LIPEVGAEHEFEIEHMDIRPEFEVLKPYFAKTLKLKKVRIDIMVKFLNGNPIIQKASSNDLKKINRDIIDSVKFQFVIKEIIGKPATGKENLLDVKQVLEQNQSPLYGTEQNLLEDILKNKNIRHYRQLVYLSQKHESKILKLRFILSPFSFVFLLSGNKQYHIVWETLDTEEATYIWHCEKTLSALKIKLKEIDADIGKIRIGGRQAYLGTQADKFSRIVHDYSNERKGFIVWKDSLEEKLL
jgi:hypothetical protein